MSAWGNNGSARSCDSLLKRVEANDPTLTELVILPLKIFTATEVERLAKALATTNTHLRSLQASGHAIAEISALEALGVALAASTSMVEVAVGDSSMGDEGVCALCRGLKSRSSFGLKRIDLSWKSIELHGLADILRVLGRQTSLESLNLARNHNIGPSLELCLQSVPPELLPIFPHLTTFDLSECQIDAKGCVSLLKALIASDVDDRQNTSTRNLSLKLGSNDLSASEHFKQMIEYILKSSLVSELHISNCQVGDESLQHFVDSFSCHVIQREREVCHRYNLQLLDLSHNNLTPAGLNRFVTRLIQAPPCHPYFSSLRQLSLAGNSLDEASCTQLGAAIGQGPLLSLEELDVTETSCGVEGGRKLLRCNYVGNSRSSLMTLNLFGNRLGSEGFVKFATELQGGHPKLESLDLGGNEAKEAGVVALLQAFTREIFDGRTNALRLLVVGGNQGGSTIETIVQDIRRIHPELDVARDKPGRNSNSAQTSWTT